MSVFLPCMLPQWTLYDDLQGGLGKKRVYQVFTVEIMVQITYFFIYLIFNGLSSLRPGDGCMDFREG